MTTNTIIEVLNKAEDKCKKTGTKLTSKRKLVLQQLIESQRLLSAYEILDRMKEKANNTMPAMSVYRILDFLESSNLVHKIESHNKYVACSHIQCNHNHQSAQFLICDNCDYVKEINLDHTVLDKVDEIADQQYFKLRFSVMEFNGLCQACQSQQT